MRSQSVSKNISYMDGRTKILKDYHQRKLNFYKISVSQTPFSKQILSCDLRMKLLNLEQKILSDFKIKYSIQMKPQQSKIKISDIVHESVDSQKNPRILYSILQPRTAIQSIPICIPLLYKNENNNRMQCKSGGSQQRVKRTQTFKKSMSIDIESHHPQQSDTYLSEQGIEYFQKRQIQSQIKSKALKMRNLSDKIQNRSKTVQDKSEGHSIQSFYKMPDNKACEIEGLKKQQHCLEKKSLEKNQTHLQEFYYNFSKKTQNYKQQKKKVKINKASMLTNLCLEPWNQNNSSQISESFQDKSFD